MLAFRHFTYMLLCPVERLLPIDIYPREILVAYAVGFEHLRLEPVSCLAEWGYNVVYPLALSMAVGMIIVLLHDCV